MGREASCRCQWEGEEADVKALLETEELILRGAIRRNIPFSAIRDLEVDGEGLTFRVGTDRVALKLGSPAAARWARAIAEPPSLASKLGIANGKRVRTLGSFADEALNVALSQATPAQDGQPELILLLARTPKELDDLLTRCEGEVTSGASIWVLYPKGKGKALAESHVRDTLRARGMVDTKVASVSAELTGLRFSHRKGRAHA